MAMFGFVFFSPPAAVTLKIGILEIHLGERATVSTYGFNVQYLKAVYILCDNLISLENQNIFLKISWSQVYWYFDWKIKSPTGILCLLICPQECKLKSTRSWFLIPALEGLAKPLGRSLYLNICGQKE